MPVLAALQAVASAAQSHAGRLGGGGAVDISLGRIIISFLICVIIAALAILLIRQRSGRIDLASLFARMEPRKREIEVVETRRLSPHADLCVVRQGGREYLLVLQQASAQVLRDQAIVTPDDAPCG